MFKLILISLTLFGEYLPVGHPAWPVSASCKFLPTFQSPQHLSSARIWALLFALEVFLVQLLEFPSTPRPTSYAEHDSVGHPQAVTATDGLPTVALRDGASLTHLVGVEEKSNRNAVAEMSFPKGSRAPRGVGSGGPLVGPLLPLPWLDQATVDDA